MLLIGIYTLETLTEVGNFCINCEGNPEGYHCEPSVGSDE